MGVGGDRGIGEKSRRSRPMRSIVDTGWGWGWGGWGMGVGEVVGG